MQEKAANSCLDGDSCLNHRLRANTRTSAHACIHIGIIHASVDEFMRALAHEHAPITQMLHVYMFTVRAPCTTCMSADATRTSMQAHAPSAFAVKVAAGASEKAAASVTSTSIAARAWFAQGAMSVSGS